MPMFERKSPVRGAFAVKMSRAPRAILTVIALVFAFGAMLETRKGSTLEKGIADAGTAVTCAIVALALETK